PAAQHGYYFYGFWENKKGHASARPKLHKHSAEVLLQRYLPDTTVGFGQRYLNLRGFRLIEICSIFLNQCGPVPHVEAFHQGSRGVEEIAELVRLPLPAVLHIGAGRAHHSDLTYLNQAALGERNNVQVGAVLFLGFADVRQLSQKPGPFRSNGDRITP